jgi:hypothetical protein
MNNIWNVSVSETPFVKLIGKEKVEGVFVEWNTDSYRCGVSNKVEQGNQSTINAVTPTVRLGNRTQISEKPSASPAPRKRSRKPAPSRNTTTSWPRRWSS